MNRLKRLFSPGVIVAVVAMVFAFGGTAVADHLITGDQIARNTITGLNIQNSSIRGGDLKDGTITSEQINPNTLRALLGATTPTDPRPGGQGPQGDRGPQGERGPAGARGGEGPQGPPGVASLESDGPYPGATELQEGDNSTLKWVGSTPDTLQSSWVRCPGDKKAVGGGFSRADEGTAAFKGLQIVTSQPVQIEDGNPATYNPIDGDPDGSFVPNGWLVEGFNNGTTDLIVRPHVICANVG